MKWGQDDGYVILFNHHLSLEMKKAIECRRYARGEISKGDLNKRLRNVSNRFSHKYGINTGV